MNDVLGHYFEEAHRNLRQGPAPAQKSIGQVILPAITKPEPPRPRSPKGTDEFLALREQQALDDTVNQNAVWEQRFLEQQDRLAIVCAKKIAFKAEAKKLDQQAIGKEQHCTELANDLDAARSELQEALEGREDALAHVEQMRQAHLHEVRLLQKGLQAKKGSQKDRVDEVWDLREKLTQAILAREHAYHHKAQIDVKVTALRTEHRTLLADHQRIRRELKGLGQLIRETDATNQSLGGRAQALREQRGKGQSDADFDLDLHAFERRYGALSEQALGLQQEVQRLTAEAQQQEDAVQSARGKMEAHHSERDASKQQSEELDRLLAQLTAEFAQEHDIVAQLHQAIDTAKPRIDQKVADLRSEREAEFGGSPPPRDSPADRADRPERADRPQGVELDPALLRAGTDAFPAPEGNPRASIGGYGMSPTSESPTPEPVRGRPESEEVSFSGPPGDVPLARPGGVELDPQAARPQMGAMSPDELFPRGPSPATEEGQPRVLDSAETDILTQGHGEFFGTQEPDSRPGTGVATEKEDLVAAGCELVAEQSHWGKTGELLQLEVWRRPDASLELHACELSTSAHYMLPLEPEVLEELDPDDPYAELFSVVGLTGGTTGPKRLTLPTLLGTEEVAAMAPSGIGITLSVYQYDSRRFFLSGLDEENTRLVELVLTEQTLTEEHCAWIDRCELDEEGAHELLVQFFHGRLQLHEGEGDRLHFKFV